MEIPGNNDDAKGTLFHLQVTSRTGKKVKKKKKKKKIEQNSDLPCDVLDIISEKLDLDDLLHFSGVCKSWRVSHKIYWTNFLASQAPLLIEIWCDKHSKPSYSFRSLPDQKVYWWKMDQKCFRPIEYFTYSGGYFIMGKDNNSLMLINPFTRINKVINTSSTFQVNLGCHALLAFGKCSQEFVFVVLGGWPKSLHVYQSRNCGWVTYPTMENVGKVIDFVVLHNIIYVVTDKANIGVLSLNSANIKFLKLKSTPNITPNPGFKPHLALVNCDEQLLLAHFKYFEIKDVYKIDFSTMSYVKLKTLGDNALFYSWDKSCYSLSNPNKWGYERNYVYVSSLSRVEVSVYSGDDKKCTPFLTPDESHSYTHSFTLDWCFRHVRYEVDYSLVE
ncbi:F-box protein At3g56470-like [Trifolium pratense]|uniref:F-box protein At3g56470-like n=1 Tax=Trifolium pratense TaxID=57577 RepID=UPI001E694356|nr:F-box protein At3g56470-like [Trifolium pratense]